MIASAGSPTVTSRSLNLVSIFSSQSRGHFSNIFVEVFGNALIFIFYLSIGPDASASSPRSFVARLVKIVSFFRRWLMGEESESVKKRKRWFKETTEWAEEGISVYQVQDGGTEGLPRSGSYRFTEHTGCPIPKRQLRCPCLSVVSSHCCQF